MDYEQKYRMLREAAISTLGINDDKGDLISLMGAVHQQSPTSKVLPLIVALIETDKDNS